MVIREIPVHAVAEEFLDLRFGKNFFYNHWVFLVFVLFVLNMYSFLYGLNELLQTCPNISICFYNSHFNSLCFNETPRTNNETIFRNIIQFIDFAFSRGDRVDLHLDVVVLLGGFLHIIGLSIVNHSYMPNQ